MLQVSPYMATPTDQPYVRVDMKSDISRVPPTDRTAFITIPQMKRLTAKVETECERLFETGTSPATSKGMYVPISFSCTISRNGPARFRVNGPTLHGLPAEPRFESFTRP